MGKPDIGSKKIIHLYNQAWLEWILQQSLEVEAELSGEFQFVARASDSLLRVKGENGHFLALTELQLAHKADMPQRLMTYAALARQKYQLDVFITVVYFLPPGEKTTIEKNYHRDFMGQTVHQDFQVISLWELDAEKVLKFNNPVLLPFIPLMQGGNTAEMLEICVSNIREQEKEQAADLEALLAVLAGYVLDPKLINQLLRWEMQLVHHSPIIQELLLEKFQSGQQDGRYQETLETIQEMLEFRFSVEATVFEEQLCSLDLKTLKQLKKTILTVQTLAEFEKILDSMMA